MRARTAFEHTVSVLGVALRCGNQNHAGPNGLRTRMIAGYLIVGGNESLLRRRAWDVDSDSRTRRGRRAWACAVEPPSISFPPNMLLLS